MVFDTDIALDEIDRCKKEWDGHEKETWLLKRIRQLEDELKYANILIKYLQKENDDLRDTIEGICFEVNLDSSEFTPERDDD